MNRSLLASAVAVAIGLSPAAFAGHRDYGPPAYGRYAPGDAYAARTTAKVVDVRPIYRSVEVRVPRDECWQQPVHYRDAVYDNNVGVGGLIGAVAGGVLGHQFGRGSGRAVATAAGAVIGASVGANTAAANTPRHEYVGYEQACRTVTETHYEDQIAAYDVAYRYNGQIYHTQMPYDPGDRIAVDVDVRPVAY